MEKSGDLFRCYPAQIVFCIFMNNSHIVANTEKLTIKQRLFCQYYVETLGKGTEAVVRAGYEIKGRNGQPDRNLAKSIASENLTKPDILEYLNTLLEKGGLNDQMVAAHLKFLIDQFEDLPVKVRAIDVYYKLHGKYAPIKVENDVNLEVKAALDRLSAILPSPIHN